MQWEGFQQTSQLHTYQNCSYVVGESLCKNRKWSCYCCRKANCIHCSGQKTQPYEYGPIRCSVQHPKHTNRMDLESYTLFSILRITTSVLVLYIWELILSWISSSGRISLFSQRGILVTMWALERSESMGSPWVALGQSLPLSLSNLRRAPTPQSCTLWKKTRWGVNAIN